MKRVYINIVTIMVLTICILPINKLYAQDVTITVSELKNLFLTYNVLPDMYRNGSFNKVKDITISYNAPIVEMKIDNVAISLNYESHMYLTFKFDILKTKFDSGSSNLSFYCSEGIDISEKVVDNNGRVSGTKADLPQRYTFYVNSSVVATRIKNGFLHLQELAKESNVRQSSPHIFDNAKLPKIIKMKRMSGNTFLISCKINGLPLDFIFDTGASSVTLSLSEANFMLKNGYLSPNDILKEERYQTASGAIQAGTKVILRRIEIGDLVLRDIEASIIHTDNAPLLLGQSALKQLGTVQIDYQNSTLTIIQE